MRKLLTAGIFGTILGIVGASTANASIVSSGFLDEKLTEYALSTSLDLKANQSDLTALSNKIGTLPDGITVANLYNGWKIPSGRRIHGLSMIAQDSFTTYDHLNDTFIDGPKPESGGYLEVLSRLLLGNGYEEPNNGTLAPFWYLTKQALRVGEIPHGKTVAGMIDEINTKIGNLPSGPIQPSKGLGLLLPETIKSTFPTSLKGFMMDIYTGYWSISYLADMLYFGNEYTGQKDPAAIVKGLRQITDEIGNLPSGNLPPIPVYEFLFPDINQPFTYPTSLAELINAIYGSGDLLSGRPGLLTAIFEGTRFDLDHNGQPDAFIGIIPNFILASNASKLASENTGKIGDLPSGDFPPFSGAESLFSALNQPLTYPTSLAELINVIYGNPETGTLPILGGITVGFPFDFDKDGRPDDYIGLQPNYLLAKSANNLANANTAKIGTVPDGKNLAGMISETDAKIGTLPTEYATVGAALTAIKGIAEDAKAAALAAIPDPKQEGSSGKFVLTVDIIGDNATYRWEKIDREGETTTTTTE